MVGESEYVVGVDTGGTFTDVVVLNQGGELITGKAATTPGDFSEGVMNAVEDVAGQIGLTLQELLARTAYFKHGTTVATNALIVRGGARVGFITTRGFEDTTLIMRAVGRVDGLPEEEVRHVTSVTKPEPLVRRDRIRGVTERIDYRGEVIIPLRMDEVEAAARELTEDGRCDALAVSLLHAWVNPAHENAIRERLRELFPDGRLFLSFGNDLARVAGEYARSNTAIVNAFVGPTVQRYLGDLEHRLRDNGLKGPFLVMQGNGGLAGREQSTPASTLQSGPAGGLIASEYMARLLGHSKVVTGDMGGTSFDVSLIVDNTWNYTEEPIFDRFRMLQPTAEIESIGAGGGTISRVDETTGRLLVGPQSAGARPGPVCYDEGGEQVTSTDVDVLLGYLDPDYFLGGRKQLNRPKMEKVVRAEIVERLGLDLTEAAAGIYSIINNKMSDLIRKQIVKSGYLPEDFVLYAFGGAGAVHAVGFAKELGVGAVYVFPTSAVFSAFGVAIADIIHTRVETYQAVMPIDPEVLNERLESIEQELTALMASENFAHANVSSRRFVSLRFRRQTYGVEILLPWDRLDEDRVRELGALFEQKYEDLYGKGSGFGQAGMEIYALRVDVVGQVTKPTLSPDELASTDPGGAQKGVRSAYFDGGFVEVAVYDYERLRPSAIVLGPAIIESPLTTIVVPPGYRGAVDAYRNVVITHETRLSAPRRTGREDPGVIEASTRQLDPIRFEIFAHRLWAIGEEGRLAMQRVTASPIVAQGGECMSSFYASDGTMTLACSGHLRFAAATSDAIKKLVELFGDSPGIRDGDQIFQNDPYIAGAHTYDQMVVKPIFHRGELIAWTASSSHTADVGGPLRGGATEIFHEGIRILGLKVVDGGEFRDDVFRSIVDQCRDPQYVGLDLKSRIAANNVCAARFLELVENFGQEFVVAAGQKLIDDAEQQARERLRSIPNGTWKARSYGTLPNRKTGGADIYQVVATLTKRDDELEIDFDGSSDQSSNDMNSTLPNTMAHVAISLTNTMFWNVPWNDGKLAPVRVNVREGSILHCRYPAACSNGPAVGQALVAALGECIAKMLYAAGEPSDVNATWTGQWTAGGPGYFYGGHNREGLPIAQGLYDIHGSGLGAAPTRDGVNSGGHMNIPSGGISDIERIELQYPFLYFTRNHQRDGGGFGKYQGGAGTQRIYMIHGSQDVSVDYKPYGGVPEHSFGLFGGYPVGYGTNRVMFESGSDLREQLCQSAYPVTVEAVCGEGWGEKWIPEGAPARVPVPEGTILSDFSYSGGGYGDPLDRAPELVARDVYDGLVSSRTAELVYGVVLAAVDGEATRARREEVRQQRRRTSMPPETPRPAGPESAGWEPILRFHEYLDLVKSDGSFAIRCRSCGHLFCRGDENYKEHALRRTRELEELSGKRLPSGGPHQAVYQEYACPGCATLLSVDILCPSVTESRPLWDIRLDLAQFDDGARS